jgi:hypothetical protein
MKKIFTWADFIKEEKKKQIMSEALKDSIRHDHAEFLSLCRGIQSDLPVIRLF